ncbi:MAG: DUF1987 domain-containing protein [Bacteroidales bacterium]
MENLNIEGGKYTPEIKTDLASAEIKLRGSSYPENANEFYQPIYDWVERYFESGETQLNVNFYIYYFNTSTSKCFMNLLEILETHAKKGSDVKVKWYYSSDDEDSLDSGEKLFMEMDLQYEFVPVDKI